MGQCHNSQTYRQKDQHSSSTNRSDENSVHSMSLFIRQYDIDHHHNKFKNNNTMSIYTIFRSEYIRQNKRIYTTKK